jgi:hypothetical protein
MHFSWAESNCLFDDQIDHAMIHLFGAWTLIQTQKSSGILSNLLAHRSSGNLPIAVNPG